MCFRVRLFPCSYAAGLVFVFLPYIAICETEKASSPSNEDLFTARQFANSMARLCACRVVCCCSLLCAKRSTQKGAFLFLFFFPFTISSSVHHSYCILMNASSKQCPLSPAPNLEFLILMVLKPYRLSCRWLPDRFLIRLASPHLRSYPLLSLFANSPARPTTEERARIRDNLGLLTFSVR